MKYVLIIPDGAADEPQAALNGQTPLQAAHVPHMDAVARRGVVGRADHVPVSMSSGSDVGTMSLFGYNPLDYHTGRAPLEAAAQGIHLAENDWAIRCNLVTVLDGVMRSFTAQQIPNDVARHLIALLEAECGEKGRWEFYSGVSYRNLLVHRCAGDERPFGTTTVTVPPHDITGCPVDGHLPTGPGAERLCQLMECSKGIFARSERNQARRQSGQEPATQIWLWGLGRRPDVERFTERFQMTAAVITAVDLLRGIGKLLGWDVIEVPGATGYLDTDYAAKGRAAVAMLDQYDFVVVHVEATDEASHEGDVRAKIEALEQIDRNIVEPVLSALQGQPDHRILICPDHPTFLSTKTHSHGFVPFALCGTGIEPDQAKTYDEKVAAQSDRVFEPGCDLMPAFLSR